MESDDKVTKVSLILRVGLAISFIYAAISSFLNPINWLGFIPNFIEIIISREIFLMIFAIFQIILGISLLANYRTYLISIISSITLFLIIVSNLFILDIVFRDIAILFMALALAVISYKKY